jgi:branched-chain amino acid transport system ATP-binding protein
MPTSSTPISGHQPMDSALTIAGLDCFHGEVQILHAIGLELRRGEVLCLLGRNGAGKTTLLKAIMGLVPARSGSVMLGSRDLTRLQPHEVPKAGVAYVPQGRRLFAELTVAENIEIGLFARNKGAQTRDGVLDLFPILRERLKQRSGTLSGGEQQMLAMARALCLEPEVLLLDEPTEGLMPSMIAKIRETVGWLRERGVSTILVEQRVAAVLPVADRVAFIENGRNRETVDVGKLRADPALVKRYVGVG